MSDRVKLAREIAARSEPRFIEIKPKPRTKLRRTNNWLFIEIPRERGGGRVPFTEEQVEALRSGAARGRAAALQVKPLSSLRASRTCAAHYWGIDSLIAAWNRS